ncbi:MAG: ABC transporter substrate-binding protein [Verrucomicrobiota bacterium]
MRIQTSRSSSFYLRAKLFCGLFATAFIAACGGGGDSGEEKKIVVGYAQVGADNPWRTALTESVQSEAKARGIDLKFSLGEGKQENQIKAIDNFIVQGVDVILLSPIVETGWDKVLKRAQRAGIPVILLDRTIETEDESYYVTFIGSNFVKEGEMAAEWMVENVKGDKVNIVEMEGTPGSAPANDRKKGFASVIEKHPRFQIVKSQTADFRRDKGKDLMESYLKQVPDIDVVYAHNDEMAVGAISAIEAAGKKPGQDIVLISIDAMSIAFEKMIEGTLNCAVECSPLLGGLAFDAVEKVLAGETLPKKMYMVDEVFDQTNAAAAMPSRKY